MVAKAGLPEAAAIDDRRPDAAEIGMTCCRLEDRRIEVDGATDMRADDPPDRVKLCWAAGPDEPGGARLMRGRGAAGTSEVRLDGAGAGRRDPLRTAGLAAGPAVSTPSGARSARLRLDGKRLAVGPVDEASDCRGATKLADRMRPPPARPGVAVRARSRSFRSERRRSRRMAVDSLRSPGVVGAGAFMLPAEAGRIDERERGRRPVVLGASDETVAGARDGRINMRRAGVVVIAAAGPILADPLARRLPDLRNDADSCGAAPAFFCARSSSSRFLSRSAPDSVLPCALTLPLLESDRSEVRRTGLGASASTPSRSPSRTVLVVSEPARFGATTVQVELARSDTGERGGEREQAVDPHDGNESRPYSSRSVPVDSGLRAAVGGL